MTAKIHPSFAADVGLQAFTHWLLFPETEEYYPFIKEVTLDRHSNRQRLREKGIQIFSINSRPHGYPTKPEYKVVNSQCWSQLSPQESASAQQTYPC